VEIKKIILFDLGLAKSFKVFRASRIMMSEFLVLKFLKNFEKIFQKNFKNLHQRFQIKFQFLDIFGPIECVRTVQLKLTEVDLKLHKDQDLFYGF